MNDNEAKDFLDSIEQAWKKAPAAHDKAGPEAIFHFARLFVKLSQEAETATRKVVRLTWALCGLTVGLLVVALIQIIIMVFEYRDAHPKHVEVSQYRETSIDKE